MCDRSTELRNEAAGETAASPAAVRVMIVDDQQPFRHAARAVVERVAGFELVAEVDSGEAAVELCASLSPDLVLMDINMGALDDLPPGARTSGAIAYVNKDELSPKVIRRLWESGGDPTW